MAYGKGKSAEEYDYRAIPLVVGRLTSAKSALISDLRGKCQATLREMGPAVFSPEPLLGSLSAKDTDRNLLAVQKRVPLNTAYAERCRLSVRAASLEHNKRYFKQLAGRLRFVAGEIPVAEQKAQEILQPDGSLIQVTRRYWHVPIEVQDAVTAAELEQLAAIAEAGQAIKLFRQLVLCGPWKPAEVFDLGATQWAIVRDIHARVQQRHREPVFGREDAVISLPLQYQVFSSTDAAPRATRPSMKLLSDDEKAAARKAAAAQARQSATRFALEIDRGVAGILEDSTNRQHAFFLDIAGPVPHGKRIRLPLAVDRATLEPLLTAAGKQFTANSLTLDLNPDGSVGVRLVVAQPRLEPEPVDQFDYVAGRDFGYKNTITLSVVKLEQRLDLEQVEAIRVFTKEQTKAFYENHVARAPLQVQYRIQMSGKPFLDRIQQLADGIEAYTSRIDKAYNTLFVMKRELTAALGLDTDARLQTKLAARGTPEYDRLQAFFHLLGRINSLKIERRKRYATIAAVKKHWFGYLSSLEVRIAREWNAIHVREHLTNEAIERDDPKYKGRVFNKMINHGARGQYNRRCDDKLAWNGIPSVALPSWYTSTTCVRHASVNAAQRRGAVFSCPQCKKDGNWPWRRDADENASDTIAMTLALVPKIVVSDTHSRD